MNLYTKNEQIRLRREMIKLEDIIILKHFKCSKVKDSKMRKKLAYFYEYGEPKETIIIDKANILVDGYTSYLILKDIGAYEVLVKRV